MAYSTKPIVNFSGGEASPGIKARIDSKVYSTMAETLENVVATRYGGALRTPGTKFAERVRTISKTSKLIPFVFSTGDAYMLEFSDQKIRFFQNNGSVVEDAVNITSITSANPAVVTTATAHGYSNGDYVDIEDVIGMTELNEKRYKVASATSDTFELQDEDGNDIDTSSGYTAYSSGGTTEKVYEVTSPYLEADLGNIKYTQQGDILYLACDGYEQRELKRFGSTNWTISTPTYNSLDWPAFNGINTSATTITPSATTGAVTLTASSSIFTADHEGSYWKLDISGTLGYVYIDTYTSGTEVSGTVKSTLGGTAATEDWYEGAWSDDEGWPVDVKFYEERIYYFRDLKLWGSDTGVYTNFDNGTDADATEDTDPVQYTIGASQVDNILWAYPTSVLNIGTAGGPFTASSGSSASPITPTSISVRQQNETGASSVSPVRIGPFLCYIERSGTQLAQLSYSLDYDIYKSDDLTYLSDHVLGDGVTDMALQRYPYNILWCVLEDGTLATLTREIEENVRGWTRQEISGTGAEVESIAVIPNGKEDQVWIVVKRTINSSTTRYIEYFSSFDFSTQEDAFFVHSGLTYNGSSTDSVTGLDHLNGESVQVLVDGAVHPEVVVSDGSITLNWSGTKIHAGLGYTSTIKTLDIEAGGSAGTSQGKVTHISKVMCRFNRTLGAKVGDGTTQDIIPFRSYGDDFDEPPPIFTGDKEIAFPSGHVKNKYIQVEQEQPLPLHLLGIFPTLISNR